MKSTISYLFLTGILVIFVTLSSNFRIETAEADKLYVANQDSNNISVINSTTYRVVATIPVGVHPVGIVDSFNGYFYVVNQGSNNISVINSTTNRVVATIPVGVHPVGIESIPTGEMTGAATSGPVTGGSATGATPGGIIPSS